MKKLVLIILALMCFNMGNLKEMDLLKVLNVKGNIVTSSAVEIKNVNGLKALNLVKENGVYKSERYCDTMEFVFKQSGNKIFLCSKCNCEYCFEKLYYDLRVLGSPNVSINCEYESTDDVYDIFSKNNFEINCDVNSYITCVSGDCGIDSIKSAKGDINITIAKRENKMIIGIPVIDVLY